MSHRSTPTPGDVNRGTSANRGKEEHPDADFGQKIGEAEEPRGGDTGSSEGRH